MKFTLNNTWITLNIIFAVCMIYCVVALGLTHKATWAFIILTNASSLLFLVTRRSALKKKG